MSFTALVTGATSGFGRAIATALLDQGWQVAITGRRAQRLQALADDHPSAHVMPFDLRDAQAMQQAVDALPAPFATLDLLVNNAGLALGTTPAQRSDPAQWRQMIDTNITGTVLLTHTLLPRLLAARGLIVNIGSVAGTYPYPGGNVYGASKAFLQQFSLNLRSDLHGTGVRVTSIEPGLAATEFTLVRTGGDRAASDALYAGTQPLTAQDIAGQVLWLTRLPPHVNINRLEVMPVSQSPAGFQVHRQESA